MHDDYPSPLDYSEKEVYAYFGLAAFSAQVLEKGLVNMVVIYKTFGLPITRTDIDQVFIEHDSKTIGQLLHLAKKHGVPIPDETSVLLSEALSKRNYLNHDFFADHAGHWAVEKTRRLMIERLCSLLQLFRSADRASVAIYKPLMAKTGVTDESLEKHICDVIREASEDKAS